MEGISGDDSAEVIEVLSRAISDAFTRTCLMPIKTIQESFRKAAAQDLAKILLFYKDMPQEQLWLDCAKNLIAVIRMIIAFAKMVPGFMQLIQDDQVVLLKASSFELAVLRMSRYYDLQTGCVLYRESMLPRDAFVTQDPEELQFVVHLFELAKSIAELKLTETELALYSAVVLINPDLRALTDQQKVRRIYDAVLRALRSELDRSRGADNATAVVDALMAKIPQLKEVSLMHRNALAKLSESVERILPPLYRELFSTYYYRELMANPTAHRAAAG